MTEVEANKQRQAMSRLRHHFERPAEATLLIGDAARPGGALTDSTPAPNVRDMRSTLSICYTIVALAAACRPEPTLESYGDDYEAALCESATACRMFVNEPQCRDSLVTDEFPEYAYLEGAVAAGRATFDGEKAAACVSALSSLACDRNLLRGLLYFNDKDRLPPVCLEVYTGKVENNGPCVASEECAGERAVCAFPPAGQCSDECCTGICEQLAAPPALPDPGEPCDALDDCRSDSYCGVHVDYKCHLRVPLGDACASDRQCEPGLYCAGDRGDVQGRCAQPAGEGEPCSVDEAQSCGRYDNYCDPGSDRCRLRAGLGDSCADVECLAYAQCDREGAARICRPLAGHNERCGWDYVPYRNCLGHLECDDGVRLCKEPDLGEVCPIPE